MNISPLTKERVTAKQLILYGIILALLFGCAAYLLFAKLDVHSISLQDESRHGINAYEMDQGKDYVVSTYLGEPDYYNLKPPLSMWGIIAGYRIFGYNALGLRMYSAVSMFLCVLVFAWWAKRQHGWVAGLSALALLVGCDFWYIGHAMRFGDAEGQYFLFYTLAMLCMLQSRRNIRWLYGSALCFGFAFLSKSWHAGMIPLTCLVYLCVTGEIKRLRPVHYGMLIVLGLLPIAPWAILRYQRDGFDFFTHSVETDIQIRMADGAHSRWTLYLETMLEYSGVVLGLLLCAAGAGLSIWKKSQHDAEPAEGGFQPSPRRAHSFVHSKGPAAEQWGLGLWILLPPLVYSFSGFRVYWYIFPMMGGVAMAGGLVMKRLWADAREKKALRALCVLLCAAMAVQIGLQFPRITRIENTNTFQRSMTEMLDREYDSGTHAYVQYNEDLSEWPDSDRLKAMLAGDVICLDGGQEAFMNEEESAILFVNRWIVDSEALEYYPVVLEEGDVWVLQN